MDENKTTAEKIENLQREFLGKLHNTELSNLILHKNKTITINNLVFDCDKYKEAIEIKLFKNEYLKTQILLVMKYNGQTEIIIPKYKDLIDSNKYQKEIIELYDSLRDKIVNTENQTKINQLTNLLEYI